MDDWIGLIVEHQELGLARILAIDRRFITLAPFRSEGDPIQLQTEAAIRDMDRHQILDGWRASSTDGVCTIERCLDDNARPFIYSVVREDGVRADVSETELEPLEEPPATSIMERFERLNFDKYKFFRSREELIQAFEDLEKRVAHLQALLSSRIDIYPHQASVAGAILLDHYRRYLLADEVGLGKTIEAGIVAQDVLAASKEARILVVCPASLTHQWLAELYSKFGGRVFRIFDLASPTEIKNDDWRLAIASTGFILQNPDLMEILPPWDLLIVDEAHRLIDSALYDTISKMSARSNSLLLLSALPARRRADELYKLLHLLDPEFYETEGARKNFEKIYDNQRTIGRRIRLAERRTKGFRNGDEPAEAVIEAASRLRGLEIISEDAVVNTAFDNLNLEAEDLADRAEAFTYLVADRYRISRRIFRNRRERLVEDGQMPHVNRLLHSHTYIADGVEIDAVDSIVKLIQSVGRSTVSTDFGFPFARMLLQAVADPSTTANLVQSLKDSNALPGRKEITKEGRDLVAEGHLSGYADFELRRQIVFLAVRGLVDDDTLQTALSDSGHWAAAGTNKRLQKLLELLEVRSTENVPSKCIVFAGHPGLAESLTEALKSEFGNSAVTEFRSGLSSQVKENNVLNFRRRKDTWILVADETGGEGRNFQYVDEIFHFDLPWNAAAIEQRIGRLDRIGREGDVVSHVITAEGSIEHAFLHCLDEGLGLFRQSISGLELALRSVEDRMVECVIQLEDPEDLRSLAEEVRETAAQERATDEADAVLDAASLNRQRAAGFARIRDVTTHEQVLMDRFIAYWKLLAPGGFRLANDPLAPGDVGRFDADNLVHGDFTLPEPLQAGNRRFQGAFKRAVVKDRPELDFFAPGNAFFDAVLLHAKQSLFGQLYAIEIEDPASDPWVGVEVVCRAVADVSLLNENTFWRDRVRQTFPAVKCSIFVEIEGGEANEQPELLELRSGVRGGNNQPNWHNLKPSEIVGEVRARTGTDWRKLVQEHVDAASARAKEILEPKVHSRLQPELERIDSEIQRLVAQGFHQTGEGRSLRALKDSLAGWNVHVESLGLLSRNGGLRPTDGN